MEKEKRGWSYSFIRVETVRKSIDISLVNNLKVFSIKITGNQIEWQSANWGKYVNEKDDHTTEKQAKDMSFS